MYLATLGIAPYFKLLLQSELAKSDIMVFSFDESLNSITQSCEMDVILRYWSDEEKKVKVRYFMLKLEIKEDLFGCLFFRELKCPDKKKTVWIVRYFLHVSSLFKDDWKQFQLVSSHKSDIANLYYTVCELVIISKSSSFLL